MNFVNFSDLFLLVSFNYSSLTIKLNDSFEPRGEDGSCVLE